MEYTEEEQNHINDLYMLAHHEGEEHARKTLNIIQKLQELLEEGYDRETVATRFGGCITCDNRRADDRVLDLKRCEQCDRDQWPSGWKLKKTRHSEKLSKKRKEGD